MKSSKFLLGSAALFGAILITAPAVNAQISATVYGSATWNGSNQITFGDPLFSFDTPAIQYGYSLPNALPYGAPPYSEGDYYWFPAINYGYGYGSVYGVKFTGSFDVTSAGQYTVYMDSDDGTVLYVNGSDVQPNATPQGPNTHPVTVDLNAGLNPFELDFFECCGGTAGVDLDLGPQISFAAPDTAEYEFLAPVLLCAAAFFFRRRSRAALSA
jgi:hypothetical protein